MIRRPSRCRADETPGESACTPWCTGRCTPVRGGCAEWSAEIRPGYEVTLSTIAGACDSQSAEGERRERAASWGEATTGFRRIRASFAAG